MEIKINIEGGNAAKIFNDLEGMLKNAVYKFELTTETKTMTSQSNQIIILHLGGGESPYFIIMEIKTTPTDSRRTPSWMLDCFKDWYDPCPYDLNPQIDGLLTEWKDKTYVNPPYSSIRPWVLKAIQEAKLGKKIVMLLPADTSTHYYADLMSYGAKIFFSHGRMKFDSYKSPAWGSMLVFL